MRAKQSIRKGQVIVRDDKVLMRIQIPREESSCSQDVIHSTKYSAAPIVEEQEENDDSKLRRRFFQTHPLLKELYSNALSEEDRREFVNLSDCTAKNSKSWTRSAYERIKISSDGEKMNEDAIFTKVVDPNEEKTIQGIFFTNAIPGRVIHNYSGTDCSADEYVVCKTISRFNHSCRANARYGYDQDAIFTSTSGESSRFFLQALRDINIDEEICVSYFDPRGLTCEERRRRCMCGFEFDCRCGLCNPFWEQQNLSPPEYRTKEALKKLSNEELDNIPEDEWNRIALCSRLNGAQRKLGETLKELKDLKECSLGMKNYTSPSNEIENCRNLVGTLERLQNELGFLPCLTYELEIADWWVRILDHEKNRQEIFKSAQSSTRVSKDDSSLTLMDRDKANKEAHSCTTALLCKWREKKETLMSFWKAIEE